MEFVVVKGVVTSGTITDNAGKYTINAKAGDVLEFSSVGYQSASLTLDASGVGDFVLMLDIYRVQSWRLL